MQTARSTLHQRFADMALRRPDAPALIDEDGPVTYAELRDVADELARTLTSLATGDDRLIAARFGRGRSAPAGFLGILGSGRGYVPVDPDYPPARRSFLLDDCGARLIVTDGGLEPDESPLAKVGGITVAARDAAPARPGGDIPADAAYVIYTSGSTGAPKGCVVRHDSVLSLLDACGEVFALHPTDVWTVFHSFSFDFSVWELWGALLTGGTAVLVPKRVAQDPAALVELLTNHQVTVLSHTPAMFGFLVGQLRRSPETLGHLRYAVLGGEAVSTQDALAWLEEGMAPNCRLINMYGITETTVHVTYLDLDAEACRSADSGRTPIGRPLPHLRVSLRDAAGRPVADGTPGEIWVAGSGVAWGYLDRPELTRERFVVDSSVADSTVADSTVVDSPLANPAGPSGEPRRFYRSGDWAVRHDDGSLHYIGRFDGQVKLRGHRIELGEVEAALAALDGVRGVACAVQPHHSGQRVLVAYVIDEPDDRLTPARLRAHLGNRLPGHLRPHRFQRVATLPVTANGKLDRAALAALPVLDWPTSPAKDR